MSEPLGAAYVNRVAAIDRRSKSRLLACGAVALGVVLYTGVVSDAKSVVGADYFVVVASVFPVVLVAFLLEHFAMLTVASRTVRPMQEEYDKVEAERASMPEDERDPDVVAAFELAGSQLREQANRLRGTVLESGQDLIAAFALSATGEVLGLYALADERYTTVLLVATAGLLAGLGYMFAWTLNARGLMAAIDAHIALGGITEGGDERD